MTQLNHLSQQLAHHLETARKQSAVREEQLAQEQKVHVVGAGSTLTAAYEQLRNAAEYTEEHVLLQRAIRRFYKRLFIVHDANYIARSGEELAIELTQAGYVANDTISEKTVQEISQLATRYYAAYTALNRKRGLSHRQIEQWTYEVLAVEVEWLLHDASYLQAFTQFAHGYFLDTIDFQRLFGTQPADVETSLYVAIHRALLKSDEAVVRLGLLRRYQRSVDALQEYIDINKHLDTLFTSATTEKLYRIVDRRGAHLRVLRHMMDEDTSLPATLAHREQFLSAYESQVETDYQSINRRVNKGIVRSVIFLVITKFLIGIAVEVPYDYIVAGMILWTPLLINLIFPPVYMLLLRATLILPGAANTRRLSEQIDRTLYEEGGVRQLERRSVQSFGFAYNFVYALIFILVFGGVAWLLWSAFSFDILHLTIFFVFLSGASFLGFRLSRMIREIESVEATQNGITLVRDFLYMPFVVVGRYMNEKYAKVNIVALALDMLIELPLKTVLRLVRQWAAFISVKKDQL
ncbi:hypothetical protein RAAC3_TM7C00001G0106 [Candidatus Saccharibacteria bacterium RAAC3_TM7_1]|nr:hypothetical protein RAAC3_TM7C00001G0106 [Candidatus Saccharibacteria bacterium RAAC3_TM7_1]HCZ28232.1 hypothetical protein [Candidatus Saccharibacteria bacterium]